jgi:DNA end-binding protein Ku
LRNYEHGLTLHTIYYPNEIHQVKEYGREIAKNLRKEEIELSEQFAKALVKPFRPEQFHDEYQARVQQLIESKVKGRGVPKPEKEKQLAPVIDLMSALKKSIERSGKTARTSKPRKLRKTA